MAHSLHLGVVLLSMLGLYAKGSPPFLPSYQYEDDW